MFDETMKLALGWSVVVAFIFTLGITLTSLVGWVKFAYPKQQQGLYAALILEVVIGSVAGLRYSPAAVVEETTTAAKEEGVQQGRAQGVFLALDARLAATLDGSAPARREELLRMIDLAEVPADSPLAERKRVLRSRVEALPAGTIAPEAVQVLRGSDALRMDARVKVRGTLKEPQ